MIESVLAVVGVKDVEPTAASELSRSQESRLSVRVELPHLNPSPATASAIDCVH